MEAFQNLKQNFLRWFNAHDGLLEDIPDDGSKGGNAKKSETKVQKLNSSEATKDIIDKLRKVTY